MSGLRVLQVCLHDVRHGRSGDAHRDMMRMQEAQDLMESLLQRHALLLALDDEQMLTCLHGLQRKVGREVAGEHRTGAGPVTAGQIAQEGVADGQIELSAQLTPDALIDTLGIKQRAVHVKDDGVHPSTFFSKA